MNGSIITSRLTYTVSYRYSALTDWLVLAGAQLEQLELGLLPLLGNARVRYPYGLIDGAVRAPVDLRGAFARVVVTDGTNTATLQGYVRQQQDRVLSRLTIGGRDVPTGDTTLFVVDSAQRLAEHEVRATLTTSGKVGCSLPYNLPARQSDAYLAGNRAQTRASAEVPYALDASSATGGATWNALDVLEQLAYLWDEDHDQPVVLAGQTAALATYEDAWRFEGMTFLAALQQLIRPTRGVAASVTTDALDRLVVTIYSLASEAVLDGAVTVLPASSTQVATLRVDRSELMEPPTLTYLPPAHELVVYGDYIRVCFTLAQPYGTLAKGWTATEEFGFEEFTGPVADQQRLQERIADVWRRYVLPPDWDGYMDAEGTPRNCLPAVDTATGQLNLAAQQRCYVPALRLDTDLPLTASTERDQPRRPLAVAYKDGTYLRPHQPGEGKRPIAMALCDDAPGIVFQPSVPHDLGGTSTVITTPAATWDWQQLFVTVSCRLQERCRVARTLAAKTGAELTRRKEIETAAQLWYVVQGTITDVADATVTRSAGEYARDDSGLLERTAALAGAWYGVGRTKVDLAYKAGWIIPYLGYLVLETDLGSSVQPTGTIISRIAYTFQAAQGGEKQSAAFATEWYDLDAKSLLRGARQGRGGSPGGYQSQAMAALLPAPQPTNQVVLPAVVDATGGGGSILRVTSGGPGLEYTADLYGDGDEAAATETGVTVRVYNLAMGQTVPAGTWLHGAVRVGDKYRATLPTWLAIEEEA